MQIKWTPTRPLEVRDTPGLIFHVYRGATAEGPGLVFSVIHDMWLLSFGWKVGVAIGWIARTHRFKTREFALGDA